jgi:RNA polymerase sigma-70 factor (ECF subfamily)
MPYAGKGTQDIAEIQMSDSPSKPIRILDILVDRTRQACPTAIEQAAVRLFDEMRVPLLRYLSGFPLSPHDSEDVVQEVFLDLFRQWQRGRSIENPRAWLFRAAHHLALKEKIRSRKENEKNGLLAAVEELAVDPALNPEDQLSLNRTQTRLESVIRALPEQHRWCLHLRAEGLRYREIAEIVGISLGKVSLSLQRSLALIARATER